jgi:hypothetical protein
MNRAAASTHAKAPRCLAPQETIFGLPAPYRSGRGQTHQREKAPCPRR